MVAKYFILLLIIINLFSCVHKQVTEISAPQTMQDELFSIGTYKQSVDVEYIKDGKKESNSFDAILKKSAAEIYMYCYVGFGYTLFKLKDHFGNPIEFTTTEEKIEKNKEFFLKMYPLIKEVLMIKKNDPRLEKDRFTLLMQPHNFPVDIIVSKEKVDLMPAEIIIENTEHFRFLIKTKSYKL